MRSKAASNFCAPCRAHNVTPGAAATCSTSSRLAICWFEIRLRHEKILREYFRVRLEGYHASRERFQFARDRLVQAFAAESDFRPRRLTLGAALCAQVERIRQQRRDPIAFFAQVNAFGRRAFQPRPPIVAARQQLDCGIRFVVRNARQVSGSDSWLQIGMLADCQAEMPVLCVRSFVRAEGIGYDG